MDSQPKTRQDKKKNQKKKARPETLGTGKGARAKLVNLEKATTTAVSVAKPNNKQKT